ncbi:MAG: integrase, partial [Rhodococcus sp. (in: high G+C Gram-positive bacteria)]
GEDKIIMSDTCASINPAAIQRQIQALTSQLITLATSKNAPEAKAAATRAKLDEATNQSSRAS